MLEQAKQSLRSRQEIASPWSSAALILRGKHAGDGGICSGADSRRMRYALGDLLIKLLQ